MSIKEKYMRMLEHGIDVEAFTDDVPEFLKHLSIYMQEATNSTLWAYKSGESELSVEGKSGIIVMKIVIEDGTLIFVKERFEDPEFFFPLIKDDIMSVIMSTLSFLKELRSIADSSKNEEASEEQGCDSNSEIKEQKEEDSDSEEMWL
jgi:hypothetical protein